VSSWIRCHTDDSVSATQPVWSRLSGGGSVKPSAASKAQRGRPIEGRPLIDSRAVLGACKPRNLKSTRFIGRQFDCATAAEGKGRPCR
jgi:hypothetical protein